MERIRAPELEPATAWLGATRPLRLRELRGQVVVLDFWTSCCVNCLHVIPVLRDLERRHAGRPLVVIGVHSAKFPGEARPERIADAIARHGIEHPVVVDDGLGIWERYAIRSWPTLVVVAPDGTIAAVAPGEPDPAALDALVRSLLATTDAPPAAIPRGEPPPPRPLAFPGKIAPAGDGRLAVADTGHHRVLVLAASGEVIAAIGSGRRGLADGPLAAAKFDEPQGLAWDGADALWICDVRNHALRRADLARGVVETVAGTGSMGHVPIARSSAARATALRSPWDVLPLGDGRLALCLAGSHQLGVVDPRAGTVDLLAGDGREALVDGPPRAACYAQPSGLARAGAAVVIADSETSAIRALDLASGETTTIVGEGLFDFGHVDGPLATARLQHPLTVAPLPGGDLVVADTYNDCLRRIDRAAGVVSTLSLGTGEEGLREPADVKPRTGGGLWVADTGNHRIVRVAADGAWQGELAVRGAPPLPTGEDDAPAPLSAAPATRWFDVTIDPAPTLAPGAATLHLELRAPAGWKLNAGAPLRVALEVSRRSDLLVAPERLALTGQGEADMAVAIPLQVAALPAAEVRSELLVRVDAMLCGGEPEVCAPSQAWLRVPLVLAAGGAAAATVALPLAGP